MNSDSDLDYWAIPRPGPKPPPGIERTAWLEANLLYRHRDALHDLLDQINPDVRRNQPVALDQDTVARAILSFLTKSADTTARAPALVAMLRYLHRGFTAWCRHHRLQQIRIPLVHEFSIDNGLLDGDSLTAIALHRDGLQQWQSKVTRLLAPDYRPTEVELASLFVMSAALLGGLATPAHWKLFLEQLAQPLNTDGNLIWFDLDINGNRHRWIADPVSEALLRRFTHLGALPLPASTKMWAACQARLAKLMMPRTTRAIPRGNNTKQAMASLAEAVKGLLLADFPPDIASIALGTLENTSLPSDAWRRLISGTISPRTVVKDEITIAPRRPISTQSQHLDPTLWEKIHVLKRTMAWNADKERHEGVAPHATSQTGRKSYVDNALSKIAEMKRDVRQHYLRQGLDGSACFSMALCHYVDDLIHLGGPRKEILAPGTIDSYFGDVEGKLRAFAVSDIRRLGAPQREEIYSDAIHRMPLASRSGISTVVQLFERTLMHYFGLDDEVDWDVIPLSTPRRTLVDANLVDEASYMALWRHLQSITGDSTHYQLLWQVLVLLLYRCGLRRGEAHELTLADIQQLPEHRIRIRVSPSRMTTNKSSNAIRTVGPVQLPDEEWRALTALLEHAQRETRDRDSLRDVYLFARPGHGSKLLDEATLFTPITRLLHQVNGDTSLRIHHFRHGFASRHFSGGRTLLASLDETRHRDAQWLASFQHDGAWLRAYELGHLNPIVSITSYCHTAELVHYFFAAQATDKQIPMGTLSLIGGLSERSLERREHRARDVANSMARSVTSMLLDSARRRWPLSNSVSPHNAGTRDQSTPVLRVREHVDEATSTKCIGFQDVLDVIRAHLCSRMDLSVFEAKGISSAQVRHWISVIDQLTALGYFRAGRRRIDRMPSTLIACGEVTLLTLAKDASMYGALLARALLGFGKPRDSICVKATTAIQLKDLLTTHNDHLAVDLHPVKTGSMQITFSCPDAVALAETKLFLLVLAVFALRPADLDALTA